MNNAKIPAHISDDKAVFIKPISAACQILSQLKLKGNETAVILGDGKIGILCLWVLTTVLSDVTLIGHHLNKLEIAQWRHLNTTCDIPESKTDIVIEATGTPSGINQAMSLCRPCGTIILKSTTVSAANINLTPIVVNEQILMGSRCGNFKDGIQIILKYPDMPIEKLITGIYHITDGIQAFNRAY